MKTSFVTYERIPTQWEETYRIKASGKTRLGKLIRYCLLKFGLISFDPVEYNTVKRINVDLAGVRDEIYRQLNYVNCQDMSPHYILMGVRQWEQINREEYPLHVGAIDFENMRWNGIGVVVIPHMDGVVVVPKAKVVQLEDRSYQAETA